MGDLSNNFSKWEFECGCGCGFDDIDMDLVALLEIIRDACGGQSMSISSGCRCKEHNRKEGGSSNSAHLRGVAVDIRESNSYRRFMIIGAAFAAGVKRIGVSKSFVHLDIDPTLPHKVLWTY